MTHHLYYPSTTQQRALAYAPKPFAALSFISCLFGMYYLLVRHPEKRERLYHRIMLATFICFLPLSLAIFIGTWAMPSEGVPWAIGESGTSVTCTIQGFIYIIFFLAFPFYYASLSVYAYLALKNNFQEEKYVWIEKWIHMGAYALPLAVGIAGLVKGWFHSALAFCRNDLHVTCDFDEDPDCQSKHAISTVSAFVVIVGIELSIGTLTIIVLLCTFEKIQRKHDAAVGVTRMVESLRRARYKAVAWQTGLYLLSFWFGYAPKIADRLIRITTGRISYDLNIVSNCVFAFQGFTIMAIYFVLQQQSHREHVQVLPAPAISPRHHQTVSKIRENAAKPRRQSSTLGNSVRYSFHIFDGAPAEDSPFRQYFEDSTQRDLSETESISERAESEHTTDIEESLLGADEYNNNLS